MEKTKKMGKKILQILLPVGFVFVCAHTQAEPFVSDHKIASFVILVVMYFFWHAYVDLVRDGRL